MKNPFNHGPNDHKVESDRNLVFAVFDEKAQTYATTLGVHPTVSVAIRAFTLACQNPETFYNRFPGDYSLYNLGTYDERSGVITSYNEPRFVIRASEIINQLKQEASLAPSLT